MRLDLDAVRRNAERATTEDLLDRVTVYRAGMEESALDVLEEELIGRHVTDEQIKAHAEEWGRDALWERPGLAYRCSVCRRPATKRDPRWRRLFGLIPLFPRAVYLCRVHGKDRNSMTNDQ